MTQSSDAYYDQLVQNYHILQAENAELRAELEKLREHAAMRIAIEESRPPLSMGRPCPKCGQIVR